TKFGAAGRARLTSGEYAQLTGRAGRRGLDDEGHAVVAWTPETALADVARVATAAPPDLHSAFRPTYNLAVNLIRRFDRSTALQVLRRSFAQWQAAAVPGRHGVNHGHDSLATLFGRRLAVLEELGYVDGWRLTTPGERLARIYHESDLLVAEIMSGDAVAGSEPSVMAGILSALVFERRRVRHVAGRARRPGRGTAPAATERPGRERAKAVKGDRLGENRRAELAARLSVVLHEADRVRALEEAHVVPRTRQPEPGLAAAVASWARGASFATALQVAEAEVGEVAPGDFVRTLKQVADLAAQVSVAADDPATAAAAGEAARLLLRDVAAAQRPEASATADGARS
ncbi:MAG TPA: hypothetical protein VKW77_09130, partial [Acidimicrobiales bacterium]|nr:hypothetical protein [Acidimicrobiales bacterium]